MEIGAERLDEILYTVRRIDGDYARLIAKGSGEEILVARALLPEETDEGAVLLWRNFTYSIQTE